MMDGLRSHPARWVGAGVVLAVCLGGGWWVTRHDPPSAPHTVELTTSSPQVSSPTAPDSLEPTIPTLTSGDSTTASANPTSALEPSTSGGRKGVSDSTASTQPASSSSSIAIPAATAVLTPEQFGARGDGLTDDTAAIRRAMNALKPGNHLVFAAGKTYRHNDVLRVLNGDVVLRGKGTLLGGAEAQSGLIIQAPRVRVDGLRLTTTSTTKRWDAPEQTGITLWNQPGIVITNVTVTKSASAGILVYGSWDFTIADVIVQDTRADAIHMTGASHNGRVLRPVIRRPGDDGVAVVSYGTEQATHHIEVLSPRLDGQVWGRGFTVVGGHDVTYRDVYAQGSAGAGIYVAAESSYQTLGVSRVQFLGGTLIRSNTVQSVQQGAILVHSDKAAAVVEDVHISGVTIRDTANPVNREVGALIAGGGVVRNISFTGIAIHGGTRMPFYASPGIGPITRTGWTKDGKPLR